MEKKCDYLIIGRGIAGYNALRELLNVKPASKIIMVSSDNYYQYDRPPLSKNCLKGKIEREMLFFESEDFYKKYNLEVILGENI